MHVENDGRIIAPHLLLSVLCTKYIINPNLSCPGKVIFLHIKKQNISDIFQTRNQVLHSWSVFNQAIVLHHSTISLANETTIFGTTELKQLLTYPHIYHVKSGYFIFFIEVSCYHMPLSRSL